ncbi:MAG: outer membrane beta-barrel protein [Nitrospira sp.]
MQIPNQAQAQSSSASVSETKSVGAPDTHVIPSLSVAERYDSNVFFVRGANLEDYVTTVSPQLKLNHRSQWVDGVVSGGAIGAVYVKHPGLNYVGGNGTVDLNLDGTMNRLVQGLGLHVVDSIYYAPQLLAYATPSSAAQGNEPFVRGLQAQRANAFRNTATVRGSYSLSPWLSVTSTYTDQLLRFGEPIAAPSGSAQGRLIDTDFQTVASGPVINLSADTISLVHIYQRAVFGTGGALGSFAMQGGTAKWVRSISPTLKTTVEGGFLTASQNSTVHAVGAASLEWQGQYTTVMLSYSRSITPSFLSVSTPLLSQVVTGTVSRRITDPLSLSVTGSYAINESVPDSSLLRFKSYSITPSINYVIGRTFTATLSFTHSQFEQTFVSQTFPFDRNIVQLSLVAEWK